MTGFLSAVTLSWRPLRAASSGLGSSTARCSGLLTRGTVWMVEFDEVKLLIGEILQLGDRTRAFGPETPLLGSIPEFDSMAVFTLIHALEQQFEIQIADDEISAETFETMGKVYEFVRGKVMATTRALAATSVPPETPG